MTVIKFPIAAPLARAVTRSWRPIGSSADNEALLAAALALAVMLENETHGKFQVARRKRLEIKRRLLRLSRDDKAPGSQR